MRVFGAIPRSEAVKLPERHLGLVQAGELSGLSACLDALADLAEAHIDIEGLQKMAPSPCPSPGKLGLPGLQHEEPASASGCGWGEGTSRIVLLHRTKGRSQAPSPLAGEGGG